MLSWGIVALAAGAAVFYTARELRRMQRSKVLGGTRHYLVDGAWHHEMCLLVRYPAATREWKSWCTCDWKRGRCFRPS